VNASSSPLKNHMSKVRNYAKCIMLYVAVAPSASDDTLYVLPVLWVTSCFRMMGPVGQNQRPVDDIMFGLNSPGGGTSQ